LKSWTIYFLNLDLKIYNTRFLISFYLVLPKTKKKLSKSHINILWTLDFKIIWQISIWYSHVNRKLMIPYRRIIFIFIVIIQKPITVHTWNFHQMFILSFSVEDNILKIYNLFLRNVKTFRILIFFLYLHIHRIEIFHWVKKLKKFLIRLNNSNLKILMTHGHDSFTFLIFNQVW